MELGALTMLEGFVAEWVHFTLGDKPRCTLFFFFFFFGGGAYELSN